MHEIELKFQLPAGARAAVDAAVAGRAPGLRVRMQAAYCDTPERVLARAGLALRVRREGRVWVQTLKGATADGMTRLEHNVPLGAARTVPVADPARHAGTPVGDRLIALLAAHPGQTLGVRFRTDLMRRTRVQRTAFGHVELAFDTGQVRTGDEAPARAAVCELEIELKDGSPAAVLHAARRWVSRFGLWLDSRSKAERGDLLARGETMAPPRPAQPVRLTSESSPAQARQQVLRSCADQIIVNASQVAAGVYADEHVHQLRVGLRRLRTALQVFDDLGPERAATLAIADAASALFRALGQARDAAVFASAFGAELAAALQAAGLSACCPRIAACHQGIGPRDAVRSARTQAFLLDLLALTLAPPGAADTAPHAARDAVARRLGRWHRRAVAEAQRHATLDDAQRHALRKHIKRLRYAVEFGEALFPRRAVHRYLKALRDLQLRLGAINDVTMAMQAVGSGAPGASTPFALGWLAERRDALVREARPDLRRFARAKPFWKRD